MLALLTLITARADCPRPIALADLSQLAATVERAFAERNRERLETAHGSWVASVPCLRDTLVRTEVARFHRIEGMIAFLGDDRQGAIAALGAARLADPAYRLPPGLVNENHPLRKLYEGIPVDAPPSTQVLPEPADGWVRLDGELSRDVPTGRPYVFQRFGADGTVVDTAYVASGASAPTYPLPQVTEPARRWFTLAVAPSALWVPNPHNSGVYGGLQLDAVVWAHPQVGAALTGRVGASPEGDGITAVLPAADLGLRVRTAGALHGWASALFLVLFHEERTATPGASIRLGASGPLFGGVGWTVDVGGGLTSGYSRFVDGPQPLGSVGLGLAFSP